MAEVQPVLELRMPSTAAPIMLVVLLGYLRVVLRATLPTIANKHHFVCATSLFNSVSKPQHAGVVLKVQV